MEYLDVKNKEEFGLYPFDWSGLQPTHLPICMRSMNIGDDIQTVSASRFWGIDSFVDRDKPETWCGVVPLCGWFGYGQFPTKSDVLVIGFCCEPNSVKNINNPTVIDWFKYVVKNQGFPALTRDIFTRDVLRKLGIEAEFGGCVTLQLPLYTGKREGLFCIDSPVKKQGFEVLTNYGNEFRTNSVTQRLLQGGELLDKIRHAEKIYTNRLHAWLPSIASGGDSRMYIESVTYQRERLSGYNIDQSGN